MKNSLMFYRDSPVAQRLNHSNQRIALTYSRLHKADHPISKTEKMREFGKRDESDRSALHKEKSWKEGN